MKKNLKFILPFLLCTPLSGCFFGNNNNYEPLESLSAQVVDAKDKYFINEQYTVTFSCSPYTSNYVIDYVLDDDGGTGFKIGLEKIHVQDKLVVYATKPGTAKFHFKYSDEKEVNSNTIQMTFVENKVDVSSASEFVAAIKDSSNNKIVNVTSDLDFTGVEYTASPSFTGKIIGNDHYVSNIDRLTTTKNDCLSLINNFSGTLDGLNFKDCKFDIVAECFRVGIFAATSTGTVKNVKIDNIQIDSNLVTSTGSLIGYVEGGTYENITATNLKIKGKSFIGGIFGECTVLYETSLKDITASGNVELYYNDKNYVGGVSSTACNYADKNKNGRLSVIDVMTTGGYVGQAYTYTGGVFGFVRNADINFTKDMSNEGLRVLGVYKVGGLYGYTSNTVITNAVNRAEVHTGFNSSKKENADVGGIVGEATNCDLTKSKNYGLIDVMSETAEPQSIGGIAGRANGDDANRGSYYYLENYGSIQGHKADCVGGIVGRYGAKCNRTMGFVIVDVDYIEATHCCGAIIGYVEINGTFSLSNSSFKYNTCTYNMGHCSDESQGHFQPAIGGYSYYSTGTARIEFNEVQNLNE